jgi:hypothetical protein
MASLIKNPVNDVGANGQKHKPTDQQKSPGIANMPIKKATHEVTLGWLYDGSRVIVDGSNCTAFVQKSD